MRYGNPLLIGMGQVQQRLSDFKTRAKEFYFQVLLSKYSCPECGQELAMSGTSECSCPAGHVIDPTLTFQKSGCCGQRLIRKIQHYSCSGCGRTIASRFIFDEQIFDAEYFRARMREHRIRTQRKREDVRRLLAENRSGEWLLTEQPDLEAVPGLLEALDGFVEPDQVETIILDEPEDQYDFCAYRSHLLADLGWSPVLFSEMDPLTGNARQDRIWRFMTLLFMDQAREIDLSQHGQDLLIRRVNREAD